MGLDIQNSPWGSPPPARDKGMGAEGGRESFQTEGWAWPLPREGRKERGPGGKSVREAGESLTYTHGEASKGCLTWESPLRQHPAWPWAASREHKLDVNSRVGARHQAAKHPWGLLAGALSKTAVATPPSLRASPGSLTPGSTPWLALIENDIF